MCPRSPISATAELLSCCLLLDLTIFDSFGRLPYTRRGNVVRTVFLRTSLLNSQNSVRLTAIASINRYDGRRHLRIDSVLILAAVSPQAVGTRRFFRVNTILLAWD